MSLVDPHVKFRSVKSGNQYQVDCPVTMSDAVDIAVMLTQHALDKIHHLRQR
jgi:hypothetical protein